MAELFADLASSTLASNISAAAVSLTVQTGDGALFPSPTGGDTCTIFLFNKTNGDSEYVTCSARSGDVLTISATTNAYNAGDVVENRPTAAFFNALAAGASSVNIQANAFNYDDTDTGSADTYEIQLSPTLLAYVEGMNVVFNPAVSNTGAAATLNIDTLGTKSIKTMDNANPLASTIVAGRPCVLQYRNNTFWLLNPAISWTNLAYINISNVFSIQQYFAEATLTDAASIAWNLNTAQTAKVTLTDNRTLANPTNMKAGATYILRIIQDATGTRTLAYGSAYLFPSAATPTLSLGAADVDLISFYCDGTSMLGSFLPNFG